MKGALEFSAGPPLYGEGRRFVLTNLISRSEAGFLIVDGRSPARCSIPITTAVKVYFKLTRVFPTRIYVRRLGSDRRRSIRLNFTWNVRDGVPNLISGKPIVMISKAPPTFLWFCTPTLRQS